MTRSIIDIFSTQIKKNQPANIHVMPTFLPTNFPSKNMEKKKKT